MAMFRFFNRNGGLTYFAVGLHILLGFAAATSVPMAKFWAYSTVIIILFFILKNRNNNNEAAIGVAYIVGQEVLMRASKGMIGYEMAKYLVIFLLILGEYLYPSKEKYKVWLIYILLLMPSLAVTEWEIFEQYKKVLSSISGPIAIGFAAYYFQGRAVNWITYKKILCAFLLPILSLGILLMVKTPDFDNIDFRSGSNFETSGGFGPVHVSSVIGAGLTVLGICIFLRQKLFINNWGNIIVFAFLLFRGLLTFSRSGLFAAAIALPLSIIIMMRDGKMKGRFKNVILYGIIGIVLGFFVWEQVNTITGGMAYNRFSGRNTIGEKKDDITSGRTDLFYEELEMFADNPIFGIGIGMVGEVRQRMFGWRVANHTEYVRYLSEHGILGIAALIILFMIPFKWYKKTKGYTRIFFVALMMFSLLCMIPAATRTSLPCFMFGLAFVKIKEDYTINYEK